MHCLYQNGWTQSVIIQPVSIHPGVLCAAPHTSFCFHATEGQTEATCRVACTSCHASQTPKLNQQDTLSLEACTALPPSKQGLLSPGSNLTESTDLSSQAASARPWAVALSFILCMHPWCWLSWINYLLVAFLSYLPINSSDCCIGHGR